MVGVVFIVRGLHMWLQRTHCRPSIRIFAITPRLFGERDEIGVLSFDRFKIRLCRSDRRRVRRAADGACDAIAQQA
jgi:hypothetical protein